MSFRNMKGRFSIIKPEWLKEYGEGLIFLSACIHRGAFPHLLRRGDERRLALKFVDFMKGLRPLRGLVNIGTKEQDDFNRKLKDLADRCGLMTVASTPGADYFAEDRWWYPAFLDI